jgi:hypothetical protein
LFTVGAAFAGLTDRIKNAIDRLTIDTPMQV